MVCKPKGRKECKIEISFLGSKSVSMHIKSVFQRLGLGHFRDFNPDMPIPLLPDINIFKVH